MGADIETEGGVATVKGISRLKGADVMATRPEGKRLADCSCSAAGRQDEHPRLYHLDRAMSG